MVKEKKIRKKSKNGKKSLAVHVLLMRGESAECFCRAEKEREMRLVAVSVYYCSLAYMIIAGIIYLASMLFILSGRGKVFFNSFGKNPAMRRYHIIMVILVPLIFALGWVFLFPFTNNKYKDAA